MAWQLALVGIGCLIGAVGVLFFFWIGEKADEWKRERESR